MTRAPGAEAQRRADQRRADLVAHFAGSPPIKQQKRSIDSLEGRPGSPKTKHQRLLLCAAPAAAAADTASGGGGQGCGRPSPPPSSVLHVRNIPKDATNKELEAVFVAHGLPVVQVRKLRELPQVRSTGL